MSSAYPKSTMNRGRRARGLACALLVALIAAGCQAAPLVRRPSTQVDPCAEQLHDLCGRFLLYYSTHNKLPNTLEDLKAVDALPMPPLACPVSGKPYIYNKDGLHVPGRKGVLILYDPAPAHSGMRWCILAETPGPAEPFTARVILLPESAVSATDEAGRQPLRAITPSDKR
jgi:hypothetical protein